MRSFEAHDCKDADKLLQLLMPEAGRLPPHDLSVPRPPPRPTWPPDFEQLRRSVDFTYAGVFHDVWHGLAEFAPLAEHATGILAAPCRSHPIWDALTGRAYSRMRASDVVITSPPAGFEDLALTVASQHGHALTCLDMPLSFVTQPSQARIRWLNQLHDQGRLAQLRQPLNNAPCAQCWVLVFRSAVERDQMLTRPALPSTKS